MILFDAHTHIYDCFDLDLFFAAAFENFRVQKEKLDKVSDTSGWSGFLLLTESPGVNYFGRLKAMAGADEQCRRCWSVSQTEETLSLQVVHEQYPGMRVVVVAGSQLVTREGLELLALFISGDLDDGMELERAAAAVIDGGGLAVCPWGAGKWLGRRGKLVEAFAGRNQLAQFFLGDSGNRPAIWPRPRLLDRQAILSGSDPLPLAGEEKRVGGYGGYLQGECSATTPAASLKELLLDPAVEVTGYGRQLSSIDFIRSQLALRLRS